MKIINKIVRFIIGFIGTTFEILRLIIEYIFGLIWTAYLLIRGKDFKSEFSKLNAGMIDDIKWTLDTFVLYII